MKNLIEALTILLNYGNPKQPTRCEYNVLVICGIDPKKVSAEDISRLDDLGFIIDEAEGCFISFLYGSV